jgi:hypothetical protein
MWEIIMIIDNIEYKYGADSNKDKANEIAIQIRKQRDIWTYVRKVK